MHRLPAIAIAGSLLLGACGGEPDPRTTPTEDPSATPTTAPTTDPASDPEATCSATDLDGDGEFDGVDPETRATAELLLTAAVECDEATLVAEATADGTRLTFGDLSPEQMFGLPESGEHDPQRYETIARLLAGTRGAYDEEFDIWTWPSVFNDQGTEGDWQLLVESGLYTQAEVDDMMEQDFGYLGWRIGIDGDGKWMFLVAGD